MAKGIEHNIFSSGMKDLFTTGTLTMESLYSHEKFIDDFQEEGKQTIIQHGMIEDMVEEMESDQNNEVSMCVPHVVALMHTCRRELSPAHLVCPRRHNV
jgi:hypothetical protein